ncbi:MAG: hypothetical protein MI810_00290 [Flavobacteriales bacterium]|jgi:regulator of cell morphogenesis and NO signaling|nr:hypothetical protein [Flavobacteriales bacterium]
MNRLFNLDSRPYVKHLVEQRFSKEASVSPFFLTKLEKVMADAELFESEEFGTIELEEIFLYLKSSHRYYQEVWIPKLENTLLQMQMKQRNNWSVKLLVLFIQSYKKELVAHIEEEEKILFVFVDNLLAGKNYQDSADFILNHFIHSHNDNVIIQLDELKKDILTFDEKLKGNLMVDVLFNQLTVFQQDLMIHGLIEDQVFIPKIQQRLNRPKD